jgi:hypothetical protein
MSPVAWRPAMNVEFWIELVIVVLRIVAAGAAG